MDDVVERAFKDIPQPCEFFVQKGYVMIFPSNHQYMTFFVSDMSSWPCSLYGIIDACKEVFNGGMVAGGRRVMK